MRPARAWPRATAHVFAGASPGQAFGLSVSWRVTCDALPAWHLGPWTLPGADSDAPVLHLAAVAFETDGANGRKLEGGFDDLAVAGAMGHAVGDGDDDFVPLLGLVAGEVGIGPGDEVVAALELGLA